MKRQQVLCVLGITLVVVAAAAFARARSHDGSSIAGVALNVKGNPYQLRVYNSPSLNTLDDVNQYVAARRTALTNLAILEPDRTIEVVISPASPTDLADFLLVARKHSFTIREISIDILLEDKWDRMVWFDYKSKMVRVDDDPADLKRKILEIEYSAPTTPGDVPRHYPRRDDVTMQVRFARGVIRADAAARLQSDTSILLVDPVTDIADFFRLRAMRVRVAQMPHLYVHKQAKFGSLYRAANRAARQPRGLDSK